MPRIGIAEGLRDGIGRRFQLQLDREALLGAEPPDAFFLVIGIHRARDVGGLHLAASDRRHHVVDRGARQPRQRALQLVVGIFDLGAREQPLHDAAAEAGILIAHRGAGRAPDRRPRLAGDRERFPRRRRRRLGLRGQHLDLVAVLQFGRQRRELAVDLAADRAVADIGMHGIGEVDHIGLARQRDQLALRREAEHLVVEQFELGMLEKLFRVGAFRQDADGMAQPGEGVGFALRAVRSASRRRPCRRHARRCRVRRSGPSPRCGSAVRRAGCRDRSRWCGSSDSRSASASRCSP